MHLAQRIFILCLAIGMPTGLFAQDADSTTEPESSNQLEEITVTTTATLMQLQTRLEYAKLEVFNSYNDINPDSYYDVECEFVTRQGSHINDRICQPAFIAILEAQAYQDELAGFTNDALLEQQIREETISMEAHMISLASEHPEFLEQTREYMQLSDEYEQLKEEHCAGKIICWLNVAPGE